MLSTFVSLQSRIKTGGLVDTVYHLLVLPRNILLDITVLQRPWVLQNKFHRSQSQCLSSQLCILQSRYFASLSKSKDLGFL